MKWLVRLSCLLVLLYTSVATAQGMGERLRVTTLSAQFDGLLSNKNTDGIELTLDNGSPLSVSHQTIVKLERYAGKRTYKKRGFLIGFGLGAVAGAAAGLASSSSFDLMPIGPVTALFTAAVLGSGLGLVGLVAGAAIETDQWKEIPKSSWGKLQFTPTLDVWYSEHSGKSIRVGLSAEF